MRIAGLQNLSLVDFPGYLAAAVFLQGCNFNCGYCQNPDLVTLTAPFDLSEKALFDFLIRRKNIVEGVVITGGEPTIHKDLPDFVRRLKQVDLKIKLDTNGSNPDQLEVLLKDDLLDYVAMDIKTDISKRSSFTLSTDTDEITRKISKSARLIMVSPVSYEFRTTCVPGIVDEEDFQVIGQMIKGAKKYCLQQFQPSNTYDKKFRKVVPYSKKKLEMFRDILNELVASVEIRGV